MTILACVIGTNFFTPRQKMSTWNNILFTVGSGSYYIYDQGQEEKRNCHSHNVSLENVTVEIQDVQNMS